MSSNLKGRCGKVKSWLKRVVDEFKWIWRIVCWIGVNEVFEKPKWKGRPVNLKLRKWGFGRVDFILKSPVVSPRTPISILPPPISWRFRWTQLRHIQHPSCDSFFAFPGSYKAGIPSLHLHVFPGPSIFYLLYFLGAKHCLFQVFTRNGIPQKTFITILRGLLETVTVWESFTLWSI